MIDTAEAQAVLTKYRTAWLAAKNKLDSAVAENSASKRAMPDNYWHAEHEAKCKLMIAQAVVAAITEGMIDG